MDNQAEKSTQQSDEQKKLEQAMINLTLSSLLLAEDSLEPKKMREFGYPEVMGLDGKPTTADKIISMFKDENINSQSGLMQDSNYLGNPGALNQFAFNNLNKLLIDNVFLGYAEYSYLLTNGIINSICSTPAETMTSEWIEFVSTSDNEDKSDKIKQLEKEFERLKVKDIFKEAAYKSFAFGGCLVYPHLKSNDQTGELEKELIIDPAKIKKGDLKYLKLIEPLWYVPIKYNTDNPFSEWFYVPEYYTVMGTITHTSRVMKFIFNEAPNLLKPNYNFNGVPLTQTAMPYVTKFNTISNTIVEIVQRLNLTVLKTGLSTIANGAMPHDPNLISNAAANLGVRVRALNATRNNLGTLAIDNDSEDIMNLQMSLQNLDKIWSQAAEFMCIVPKTPATELLGISPQGFNSSGEYELKKYHQHINNLQETMFRSNLINIMHLAMINIFGEIDEEISFVFRKLDTANELEQSQIKLNESIESTNYYNVGAVSSEDIRKKLSNDKESGWNELEAQQENFENEDPGNYGAYAELETTWPKFL